MFTALLVLGALGAWSAPEQVLRWDGPALPAAGAKGGVALRDGGVLVTRTEGRAGGVVVVCSRSDDSGRTWREVGLVVSAADPRADLGDGCLLQRRDGSLLYSYRDNRGAGPDLAQPTFAIRVRASGDGGRTWRAHSDVATSTGAGRGLWSSFLLERRDGTLQCYYDDEATPDEAGLRRHQWLTMRTWEPKARAWVLPVTVSRAHDPAHLSRDGMASVVETGPGRLTCVFESVQTSPPHAGVIRMVMSRDGGRTWSWRDRERAIVYEPTDRRFAAYAPWLGRLADGSLLCVFGTNEDRAAPSVPGSPPPELNLDIKYVSSPDGGKTWSRAPVTVYEGSHRDYMPGVVPLPRGRVLFLLLDTGAGFRGRLAEPDGQQAGRAPRP